PCFRGCGRESAMLRVLLSGGMRRAPPRWRRGWRLGAWGAGGAGLEGALVLRVELGRVGAGGGALQVGEFDLELLALVLVPVVEGVVLGELVERGAGFELEELAEALLDGGVDAVGGWCWHVTSCAC